jgi:hypothetical protein
MIIGVDYVKIIGCLSYFDDVDDGTRPGNGGKIGSIFQIRQISSKELEGYLY